METCPQCGKKTLVRSEIGGSFDYLKCTNCDYELDEYQERLDTANEYAERIRQGEDHWDGTMS